MPRPAGICAGFELFVVLGQEMNARPHTMAFVMGETYYRSWGVGFRASERTANRASHLTEISHVYSTA